MNLHNRILELKQVHHKYGHNGLLFAFSLDLCKEIDNAASTDQFCKKTIGNVLKLLENYDVGYEEKLKSAYEVYAECAIYLEINTKGLGTEKIPEGKESKPDFKVSLDGVTVYFEAKVLGWASGGIQHNDAIEEGLNAQIDIEKQIKDGKQIATGISEISPLGTTKDSLEKPEKYFIEAISSKLSQNVKPSQLGMGPTFLICDLSSLKLPSEPYKSSIIVYNDDNNHCFSSGELWHIAFGEYGDRILNVIEFEGKPNVSGRLERDGVLIEHKDLIGVIFRVSPLSGGNIYTCLCYSDKFEEYGEIIVKLCDYWNDEENSNAWEILQKKDNLAASGT